MITACAELARRIVKGGNSEDSDHSSVKMGAFQSWIKQDGAEGPAKKKPEDGDVLIVVGYGF